MIRRGAPVRASSAGRSARRRGRARNRGLRHLREPDPPVRVRAERLDERSEFQRARQRTRPDYWARKTERWSSRSRTSHSQEIVGLPAFTTLEAAHTSSCPGIKALSYLPHGTTTEGTIMSDHAARTDYNQNHVAAPYTPGRRRISIYWTWSYPWEAQRDPAAMDNRFSTMTEVRNVALAGLRDARMDAAQFPSGHRRNARAVPPLDPQLPEDRRRNNGPSGRRLPAHRPGRLQAADRRTHSGRHRHPDGVRTRPSALRAGGGAGGDRRASANG